MNGALDHIWQDFLKIIKEEVGSRVVETWIKAVILSDYDAIKSELHIKTPNIFVKNWVEAHYKELFVKHLKRLFGVKHLSILFSVQNHDGFVMPHDSTKIVPAIQESKKKRNELIKKVGTAQRFDACKLNMLYTFESFVVGEANKFAFACAQAVSEKIGTLYNPLLLYGSSGLGKTHLLQAIGNQILMRNPDCNILYQSTDRFIADFIQSVRFDAVAKFQARFKDVDVLLIDDIQYMINKEQTQEIFFQIFNMLYETNKQIVLTCDVLPRHLGGLVDRLKSRLEWGLVADLQMPCLETKIAILQKKAMMQSVVLDYAVACVIAKHKTQSIRELEGALIRILAYASLTEQNITIDLIHKVLDIEHETRLRVNNVDLSTIMQVIKKNFNYDLQKLRSKDRSKDVSYVRQITMYLMKQYTNKSLREIGEFLERKDHTTITHAIDRVNALKRNDERLAIFLKNLEKELY